MAGIIKEKNFYGLQNYNAEILHGHMLWQNAKGRDNL